MFKRAYLSVKRRKTKTIILFLFLFIISTLVLSSISIKNATKESMNVARKSLSSEVTLSMDMEKMRENFKNDDSSESSSEDRKIKMEEMHTKMSENSATIKDVEKISKLKYVKDVKYTFEVNATESSFSLYTNSDSNGDDKGPGGDMPGGRNNNSLQVQAINTFKLDDDYVNGTITLESGKAFEEDDEDSVIISYELATTNSLSVGDTIKVKDSNEEEHELKIIGIYQNSETGGFNNNYNKIYINAKTGEKFLSDEEYNDGNYSIRSAVFYLDDPENADSFIKLAKKTVTDLEDRNLTLDIDTQTYDQMVSSIKNVSNLSNTILIIVTLASIVVISLITINSLKDRNYELGVLLGLGEKKLKIVGQFIVELFIIASVSFILAIGSSKLISQKLADSIIQSQNKTEEKMQEGPNGGRGNKMMMNSNVKAIESVDVNVSGKNIGLLFIIGYGIIIMSMVLPSIKILNSDPKDILSRKD